MSPIIKDPLAGQCAIAAPNANKNILKILSKKSSLRFCARLSYNLMYVPQSRPPIIRQNWKHPPPPQPLPRKRCNPKRSVEQKSKGILINTFTQNCPPHEWRIKHDRKWVKYIIIPEGAGGDL